MTATRHYSLETRVGAVGDALNDKFSGRALADLGLRRLDRPNNLSIYRRLVPSGRVMKDTFPR